MLRHMQPQQLRQPPMVTGSTRKLSDVLGVAIIAVFMEWRELARGAAPHGAFSGRRTGLPSSLLIAHPHCRDCGTNAVRAAHLIKPVHGP